MNDYENIHIGDALKSKSKKISNSKVIAYNDDQLPGSRVYVIKSAFFNFARLTREELSELFHLPDAPKDTSPSRLHARKYRWKK